jgi:cell division protein FtsB
MKELRWDIPTLQRNAIYVLLLVCIVLVVHDIFGQHGFLAMRRQQNEVQALQQQMQRLQQENLELEKQIHSLRSDPKAIERVAREQMRMARPGEIIYTLPNKETKNPPPLASSENPPPKK